MEANKKQAKISKFILLDNLFIDVNAKDFYESREIITRSLFAYSMVAYYVIWFGNMPENTPVISMIVGFLMAPIYVFCFNFRANTYLFRNNLLHIVYYLFSFTILVLTLQQISKVDGFNEYVPVGYEAGQLILTAGIGYLVAALVSFPFKIVHLFIFDALTFYYHDRMIESLEHSIYPDRLAKVQEQRNKVVKSKMKFEGLNETQLNIELSLALKEERFEDATEIRNILEKRFGH